MAGKRSDENSKPSSDLRRRAEKLLRARPAETPTMPTEDVQALVHELSVHQMELEIQNEELRESQVELSHTRDRYVDLYEFAPVGYVTLDQDGIILEANLTSTTILGVDRRELLKSRLTKFVTPESQDDFYLHQQAVFSGNDKESIKIGMHKKDGTTLVVSLESIAFDAGSQRHCRTALIDVTATQRIAQKLAESEDRYRRLTEAAIDYTFTVRVENGQPIETIHNANCEYVTGYSADEFAANSLLWIDMVPEDDRPSVKHLVHAALDGQSPDPLDHRIRRKNGVIRWVRCIISPHFNNQGRLIAYDGLIRDITDQKEADLAVRELNIELDQTLADRTAEVRKNLQQIKLLSEAIANLGEGIIITSDDLNWPGPKIVFVNEAMCQITGYAADELIGRSPRILQGVGTDHQTLTRLQSDLSLGHSSNAELINYRKNGEPYDTEIFVTPLFDPEGHRTNFVSVHRDISERKKLERERDSAFQAIGSSREGILLMDTDGRITYANPAFLDLFDFDDLSKLIGHRVSEIFADSTFKSLADLKFNLHHITSGSEELSSVRDDSGEFHIEVTSSIITIEGGKPVGCMASFKDITARHVAEAALVERDQRLRAILNTAIDAIFNFDQRGLITDTNLAAEQMLGYPRSELIGEKISLVIADSYRDNADGRFPEKVEIICQRKDGSTFPADMTVSEVDHLGLFTGILRDITERKQIEQKLLRVSEAEKRELGHDLHDSICQELRGLAYTADALAERLNSVAPEYATQINRIADKIVLSMERARKLSHSLDPVMMEGPEGLTIALSELANTTKDVFHIDCRFKCVGEIQVRNADAPINLYRIAQEAVHNAFRHGRATRATITLEQQEDRLLLTILDNGSGLTKPASGNRGLGLRIMQYRTASLGGTINIVNRRTKGVKVACVMPNS